MISRRAEDRIAFGLPSALLVLVPYAILITIIVINVTSSISGVKKV